MKKEIEKINKTNFLKNKFSKDEILIYKSKYNGYNYWLCKIIDVYFSETICYTVELYDDDWDNDSEIFCEEKELTEIKEKVIFDKRSEVIYTPNEENYFLTDDDGNYIPSRTLTQINECDIYKTRIEYQICNEDITVEIDLEPLFEGKSLKTPIELEEYKEEEDDEEDESVEKLNILEEKVDKLTSLLEKLSNNMLTKEDLEKIF